jgi:predicted permease
VLCRHTPLDRKVWDGVERLVYYVLFPALLVRAILANPFPLATAAPVASAGVILVAVGVALAFAPRALSGVDGHLHASGAQIAFRFNSYVALALCERLAGSSGLALMALLIAVTVPLCNLAAVWPLARQGGLGYGRELLRNPLILATLGGLAGQLMGIRLPGLVDTVLSRMGAAALPLGLMAVGAGLQFGALRAGPRLAVWILSVRHLWLPLAALAVVLVLPLSPPQQEVVMVYAALPTSAASYVLAVRMGGHGPYVAGLVTVSTLVAMAGLPLALAALAWFQAGG